LRAVLLLLTIRIRGTMDDRRFRVNDDWQVEFTVWLGVAILAVILVAVVITSLEVSWAATIGQILEWSGL